MKLGSQQRYEARAKIARALAHPNRLMFLDAMNQKGEMCVCELMAAFGVSQSNISFHLRSLKNAGLVNSRKVGKWMYYSLNREAFDNFGEQFGRIFDATKWPEKPRGPLCDDVIRGRPGNR